MPRASPEYNLAVKFPDVAKEWHPTKNGDLRPEDVTHGSNKKCWWICEKGHEWETIVKGRSRRGCPYCSNQKIWNTGDERDTHLMATHPEVAAQWHPTKNVKLTPYDVTFGSGKKVWWICEKEHEWDAVVHSRSRGSDCAECIRERRGKKR